MAATIRRLRIISLGFFVLIASAVQAATWVVNADGSGDVATIQNALDIAASGDVIQLGAGVFDDYLPDPHWPGSQVYLWVTTDDLTIAGAGRDLSIIGRQDNEHHEPSVDVVLVEAGLSLEIRDLTLQLDDSTDSLLMKLNSSSLVAANCAFRGAENGVFVYGGSGILIDGCEFEGIEDHALNLSLDGHGTVENCRFSDVGLGILVWGDDVRVADSEFVGDPSDPCSVGANVGEMSSAAFRRCTFRNHGAAGLHLEASTVDLNDCHIGHGGAYGLNIFNALLRGRGNVITGTSAAILVHRAFETHEFERNHIIAGGGWAVETGWFYGQGGQLDLAHNWWGTDDPQQIADAIYDLNDDPDLLLEVVFAPFLDEPTANEARSLSDIKALFR